MDITSPGQSMLVSFRTSHFPFASMFGGLNSMQRLWRLLLNTTRLD